ncbi:MAG: TIGR02221 family CRISPR-associated protein [Sulfurospirillum sp.]|nr:TIGR02221 family CRISPR-associated protein [Sulfurospirillum sp.]
MAKILISLLGTGQIEKNNTNKNEYKGTDYIIEKTIYSDEKFVSLLLVKHYKIDKLFLVGTNQSMWDMVAESFKAEENYQFEIIEKKDNNTLTEDSLFKLNDIIGKGLKNSGSKCFIIKDGENQEELWSIFEKFLEILDSVDEGDEVYFDITHLFRSLSVMSFVMLEFGKTYKKFKIAGVFYGMLKKGEPSVIVDLSIFFELLEWAKAIKNLKEFGNGYSLMQLIKKSDESNEIKNSFSNFSHALSISDMGAMRQSMKQIKGKLKLFDEANNRIIGLVSKELREFINSFDADSLGTFQMQLAQWYANNKNYSMAYITLVEAVLSVVCESMRNDPTDKEYRDEAKNFLWDFRFSASGSKEKEKVYAVFTKVNNIRKNIAHKTSTKGSASKATPKSSIENISEYIMILKNIKKYI